MIRVIIEVSWFETDTAKDIFDITTKLQADFCMTPLLQSYPFDLDTGVSLPIEVEAKAKDGIRFHRQVIQNAQASIIKLEKQLEKLHFSVNALGENDDVVLKGMLESWQALIPQIEEKIQALKMDFQNLVAQKYIELASLKNWDDTKEVFNISLFQADMHLNNHGKNGDIKTPQWLKTYERKTDKLEAKLDDCMEKVVTIAESLWEEKEIDIKIERWILSQIEQSEWWTFVRALITGTKQYIHHNGMEVIGFKLDGVERLLDIQEMRIDKRNILIGFDAVLPGEIIKYFYINSINGYTTLSIERKKSFHSVKIEKYDQDNSPKYGSVVNEDWYEQYFYKDKNWKYKFIKIEWKKEFTDIWVYNVTDSWIPYFWAIKNENENKQYFYLEEGTYVYLEIEWEKEFQNINYSLTKFKDEKPSQWIIRNLKWAEQYFYKNQNWTYDILEIDGKRNVAQMIWWERISSISSELQEDSWESQKPLHWKIAYEITSDRERYKESRVKYFYQKGDSFTFLDIDWHNIFKPYEKITKRDTTTWKPIYWNLSIKSTHDTYFYEENNELKLFRINGKIMEIKRIDKQDENTWKPICGLLTTHVDKQYFFTWEDWEHKILKIVKIKGLKRKTISYFKEVNISKYDENGYPLIWTYQKERGKDAIIYPWWVFCQSWFWWWVYIYSFTLPTHLHIYHR